MYVADIIWLPHILDKLVWKHHVSPEEVEEVLFDTPLYRKVQKGSTCPEKTCTLPWGRRKQDDTSSCFSYTNQCMKP